MEPGFHAKTWEWPGIQTSTVTEVLSLFDSLGTSTILIINQHPTSNPNSIQVADATAMNAFNYGLKRDVKSYIQYNGILNAALEAATSA